MNNEVKVAKIRKQTADNEILVELLRNPIIHGFAFLELNHLIYKTGFYDANTTIRMPANNFWGMFGAMQNYTPDMAAGSMHDTIASWIMLCTTAEAIAPLLPTLAGAAGSVVKTIGTVA